MVGSCILKPFLHLGIFLSVLSDFFFLQSVTRHNGEERGVGHRIAQNNIKLYDSLSYTVVLSLEDDSIVKILLYEDSGDEVIL